MKKVTLIIAMLSGVISLFAQGEMKPVTDAESFKKKMAAEAKKVTSIESDFVQVKYMSALSGEMESKGKFYYQKEDKVSLEYTAPIPYQIVINGSKIKMVSNGKSNVMDVASNGLMKEMKDVISACMTGNLQVLDGKYKMEFLENANEYLVKIYPLNNSAKSILDEVNIYFNKAEMSVARMKMIEPSQDKKNVAKDYTEYRFSNQKLNSAIPASRFAIK
jgi:outer membrane lipoprotein-sorting protein